MKQTDKMREAIAKKKAKEPKKEKPDPKAVPVVKHACGHERAVSIYEAIPCGSCREAAKKAAYRKEHGNSRFDQRLEAEKDKDDSRRLPDESTFTAVYDAAKKRWTGVLVLGKQEFGPVRFKDDSGAIMKLLKKLDAQYREHLAKKVGAPCNPETTPG